MRNVLFVALGMFLMFIILKILSGRGATAEGETTARLAELATTGQALNLIRTNEFRELVKTPEFKALVKTLADEQVTVLANSLVNQGLIK